MLAWVDNGLGVDEAGRGPLFGPVVAAACVLAHPIEGLNDSKKLSEKKRLLLAARIQEEALAWSIGMASAAEIDELNILQATFLAMQRAVEKIPSHLFTDVFVDGTMQPHWSYPTQCYAQGDGRIMAIAAASILAKTVRDAHVMALAERFPGYGLEKHKGYPTAAHREALMRLGATSEHRRSFAPVRHALEIEG